MDGYVAPLDAIVELAERYGALVMVDDSHAVGFDGPNGEVRRSYSVSKIESIL